MTKQIDDIEISGPKRLNLRLRDLNKTLTTLAAPSIVENCLYSLVFLSDTIIVGRLHNENFLAAAALAGILMFLVTAPFIALSMAATSIVARSWGEAAYETARKHAGCAMVISFLMAGLLFAAAAPFAGPIIRTFGASEEVTACGGPYLRILLISCLTGLPMMVSNGMLRGMGDTYRPMLITGLMNVVNVVASIMLAFGIFAPKLGFYGVAWGTVIARTFGIFFSLGLLVSAKGLQIRAVHFLSVQKNVLARIWYLAWPAYIERGLTSFYYMLFMKMVAHLGTTVLAAHQIALQIENLAGLPAWGLAIATTTITGQAVGAGRYRVARIAVNKVIIAVSILTAGMCGIFLIFGPQIVRIFGATDEVVHLAGIATQLSAIELPFLAITFIFVGALRGVGDVRSPMYVSFVSMLLCRLGGVYVLAYYFKMGLVGVWLSTALDWIVRSIGLWWFFKREAWTLLHQKEKARFDIPKEI
jgi:MATE family multidrug resistance protein